MGEDRGAKQDRVLPVYRVQQMRFPDDAGHFVRMRRDMAIVVQAIGHTNLIQSSAQIQKNAFLPAGIAFPADDSAHDAARIPVEGEPPIRVGFLVKEIKSICSACAFRSQNLKGVPSANFKQAAVEAQD